MSTPASTHTISLPEGYGWILIETVIIIMQCVSFGVKVYNIRTQIFNNKFYEKNFPEWQKKYGSRFGYPDMGGGRLSEKLTDDEWLQFNNAQRIHQNYLEWLVLHVVGLLISGLVYTRAAFLLGVATILFRQLYGWGYQSKGASGREIGNLPLRFAGLGTMLLTILVGWQFSGGVDTLTRFLGL